jgi:hypothetical protein
MAGCSAISFAAVELAIAVLSHAATIEFSAILVSTTGLWFGFGGDGVGARCSGFRMARRVGATVKRCRSRWAWSIAKKERCVRQR